MGLGYRLRKPITLPLLAALTVGFGCTFSPPPAEEVLHTEGGRADKSLAPFEEVNTDPIAELEQELPPNQRAFFGGVRCNSDPCDVGLRLKGHFPEGVFWFVHTEREELNEVARSLLSGTAAGVLDHDIRSLESTGSDEWFGSIRLPRDDWQILVYAPDSPYEIDFLATGSPAYDLATEVGHDPTQSEIQIKGTVSPGGEPLRYRYRLTDVPNLSDPTSEIRLADDSYRVIIHATLQCADGSGTWFVGRTGRTWDITYGVDCESRIDTADIYLEIHAQPEGPEVQNFDFTIHRVGS